MRIDNFYVDVAYGTAGELIPEGAVNPITGETLLFGVNAFYYLNNALDKMAPGQNLYINGRLGNNVATRGQVANIYLTGSTVPVLINGYTNGDRTYTGDIWVTIEDSTIATAAGSYLFGYVSDGEPWNHQNRYFGSATVNVINSEIGGTANAILLTGCSFNQFYGTEEDPALIQFNFKDSVIRDDLLFIGDSPVGKTVEIDGKTYIGANVEINFDNVYVPNDKWWRIQDGDQESEGTVTVNIKGTTIGKGDQQGQYMMRFSLGDWSQATPRSNSDFIFNVENSQINGNLSAGRADANFSELPGYTGAKTLNLAGENSIKYTYWFKTLNLASDAIFTGLTLRMASSDAAINIDLTGYTGGSKVFIAMENPFENITVEGINVIGLDPEAPAYQIVTDFDPEAEAPAITTVVLKGAVKDIYVNSEYTAEDLKLGSFYSGTGEALFFGENAFGTAEEAIAALTVEGAGLYVTGGKVKTAALPANSLTIDASAQLTYSGNSVITIDGTLSNAGTLLIQAAGFIDETSTDILVLTATAITGEGVFRTDNSAYSLNLVGNELHLVMKKLDVFVNTEWEGLEDGAEVKISEGVNGIIGEDAFATADAAAAKVSANGSITILASDVAFTNAITRTVIATAGSVVRNANIGTGTAVGSLTLQSGAVATAASVRGKGTLTVDAGATVTGGLGMLTGAKVTFAEGSTLNIDISAQNVGDSASVTNFSILTGAPTYTITASASQKDGDYALASNVGALDAFTATLTVGTESAVLSLDASTKVGDSYYTLKLVTGETDNSLVLNKMVSHDVIYVNSTWTGLADGTEVKIGDVTAIIGDSAFALGDDAVAKATAETSISVAGGVASFTAGVVYPTTIMIGATLTDTDVNGKLNIASGATLAGKSAFGESAVISVAGTVAFDTQYATAESAQFTGFSKITGETATYTLTAAAATGTYLLATDAAAFNSAVTFGDVTLTVGAEAVKVGDFTYALGITDNNELALTIAEYIPPTPETPTQAYVNSEWSSKKAGDIVTVGDKTATIGYDAFAALDAAIAGVTDDGKVNVVGGEITFGAYSKTITVDAGAKVVGKNVFDKAITINGTVAFDTAVATAEAAQISGLSFVSGTATYTLTDAAPAAGTYLLASDAASFNSTVTFGDVALTVGAEAVTVGDFTYALGITDNNELALTIAEKPVPPTPTELTQAFANSEWTGLADGTVIGGATIGYDGFATLGAAEAAVTADGKVNVTGGEITFGEYSKTITVDAGAKVVGKNVFDKAITINGTVAFDTAVATAEAAQISGLSFVSGTATYTLTDAAPAAGTYLLASDAASFNSTVTFGATTLTVGADATLVGSFTYALSLTDGTLALTVAEYVPPTPTYDLVYANSAWTGLADGTSVTVGDKTATIGQDAFASADMAILNVTDAGLVEIVGGEATFTNTTAKAVTVDAGATLVGKNTFGAAITINGTVAFDTAFATAEAAQFGGFSFVSGDATYTLTAAAAAGTYLLASEVTAFTSDVTFGDVTLTVGAEATVIGDFTYALSLADGKLALTIAEKPVPPTPTELTQAFANSEWAGLADGTVIGGATIGYDGFATLGAAEAAVTADGKVNVTGGEITFGAYSKTITVDAAAKVVGKNTFDKAITINGTVAFDTAFATSTAAQITGFSFVSGTATYTLTAAAVAGTYLLASDAAAFNSDVTFGEVTLKVGAEAVTIGSFTYALGITDNNELALTIASVGPGPEPPTGLDKAYVNSEWAGQPAGTVIGGATIGYDGFVTLPEAEAVVKADGSIEVVGGSVVITDTDKAITVDAGATVVGKADFTAPITINGTVAFDTQYATATEAQFTGFSNVSGTATYTLTGAEEKGTYLLATDAAAFNSPVTFGEYTLTLDEPVEFNETRYGLDVTRKNELVLTVAEIVDGPDNGWNNYVYNKKSSPAVNPNLDKFVVNELEKGVEEVFLDDKYTVYIDGKHNFVNGAKATVADTADYAKIVLDSAASLSFRVDATAATKFSIYQLVESKGKLSLKKKQSTALKKDKATGLFAVTTKNVLLEAGTYYIAIDCTDKKAFEDLYNVYVNDAASTYFDNGDTGWNNYVYDKKATPAKNPDIDKFVENKLVKNGTNDIVIEGTGTEYLQLDDPIVDVEGWSNFVGFGDAADYAVLNLEHATSLSLSANALDASKLVIYSFDGVSKMKALQTTTLKKAKGATEFSANTKNLLLEAGTYFVSMQSTNAKKGGNAYYNVKLNDATTVYDDGDNGWNNYVYDKKATPQVNPNIGEFVVNEITSATTDVTLDNEATAVEGWSNFVGFGDTADYAKIFVAGNSAKLSFNVTSTDAAKFIIYSFDGVSKMKALQTSTLKKAKGATLYTVDTKALALAEGEYFISVQSTNAKKGGAAYYNVAVNQTLSSGLLDVSAAVSNDAVADIDNLFVNQSVDTFADVAAFNADSQLIDDKQSWQSIAALA